RVAPILHELTRSSDRRGAPHPKQPWLHSVDLCTGRVRHAAQNSPPGVHPGWSSSPASEIPSRQPRTTGGGGPNFALLVRMYSDFRRPFAPYQLGCHRHPKCLRKSEEVVGREPLNPRGGNEQSRMTQHKRRSRDHSRCSMEIWNQL